MPIGFLVAALAMATGRHLHVVDTSLLVGALLAGLPILDTALVSISRKRRGVTLMTGGRDHLTHRLQLVFRTPRAVAGALAAAQGALCAVAIAGDRWGSATLWACALGVVSAGVVAVAVLDRSRWRPADIAVGRRLLVGAVAKRPARADSG
jgi:UDP-GlcNAc:undecaprenyl-phosphate GlcNAc-1-phosphate transferase